MKKAIYLLSVFFIFVTLGCGSSGSDNDLGSGGEIQTALKNASKDHDIPQRLILAAAYLESGLSTETSNVVYSNSESRSKNLSLGLTSSAFGLSRGTLQIPNNHIGDSLAHQITAYARWVRAKLDQAGVKRESYNAKVNDTNQLFKWIWKLAELHRSGAQQTSNIRVFFANEMIEILNEGFIWQDPDTKEIIALPAEGSKIQASSFSQDIQRTLMLTDDIAQIPNARQLQMLNFYDYSIRNNANHIEVVHCPLSLSACLELQSNKALQDVYLGAHYVIQQDSIGDDTSSVRMSKPLQIAEHEYPVYITDSEGNSKLVQDAIVIMLVGRSGKYVNGVRNDAQLNWYTAWQLEKLGLVINNVCNVLSNANEDVDAEVCKGIGTTGGVKVHAYNAKKGYKWGDVVDYDSAMFTPYIRKQAASIDLKFDSKNKAFKAGEKIKIQGYFQADTEWIKLERAIRCPDKRVLWTNLQSEGVRGNSSFEFEKTIFDGGPNSNGQHFIRLVSYDAKHKVTGWVIKEMQLSQFDEKASSPVDPACFL